MANLFQPSLIRVVDNDGVPVANARMYFYLSETELDAVWYTDADGTIPGANPLLSDAYGVFPTPAYLDKDTVYRVRVTDAGGVLVRPDADPVRGYDEAMVISHALDAEAAAAAAEAAAVEAQASEDDAEAAAQVALQAAEDAEAANGYRVGIARATLTALNALAGPFTEGTSAAVYADGTASNNGVYSYTSGAWVKVADLPEVTAAAAAALLATSYSNIHGTGDRRSIAVITDFGTGSIFSTYANWQQLIDGTVGGATPALYFLGGAVAGRILAYVPKVTERAWFTADKIRIRWGASIVNGTWEPVGFKGVTYDSAGVPIGYEEITVLGSAVALTGTDLEVSFTNSAPYEAYGFRGVSGSAAATGVGTGIHEINLKTHVSDSYGRQVLPNTASAGQTVRVDASGRPKFVEPREPEGRSLLNHLWLCDEGHGRYLRDQVGGIDLDLGVGSSIANKVNIGTSGSAVWDKGEVVLTNAAISTGASITCQTTFFIYESVADAAHYAVGLGNNNNQMHTTTKFATVNKLKMLHSLGINPPVFSGNNTQIGFANGGTSGSMSSETGSTTAPLIINANRNTDWAGMAASPIRVLAIATMATDPTASEAAIVQDFLDWHMAQRGRVLTGKYAKKKCAIAVWTGESTHHTSLVMDGEPLLTEAMRKKHYNTYLMAGMGPSITGAILPTRLQKLSYWMDRTWTGYQLGNESTPGASTANDDRNRKMGPLYGFAEKELYADTPHEHPIIHFKVAQGGTLISPYGKVYATGGTVQYTDTFDAGATTGATLFLTTQCQGWGKFEAEIRRQGYGIEYITHYHALGLNDASNLLAGEIPDAATFQSWLQISHDRWKSFIGVGTLPTYVLVPHLPIPGAAETYAAQCGQPGVTGYTNDAAGRVMLDNLLLIRTACRNFDTANADVTGVEADTYGTNIANGDSIHMGFTGMATYGGDSRRRYSFATKIVGTVDVS